MPIQQKAQTTKELKLSEKTLEELYHPEFTLHGIFRSVSRENTVSEGFVSFFFPFFFFNYLTYDFMGSEEQL